MKLEVPKGWTITKIENDDPNATLTAADYNLANGQMAWTSADAEDKSVSKFVTYTVEIPANTAAGTYELKVTGVNAWKNYAQDAVLTKGQHDSTLTLTVKEKTTAVNAPEQDSLLRGEPGVHHHDYGSAYHPHCNVLPRRHSSNDGEPYAKEKNSKIRCQYAKEGGWLWPELTERTEK